MEIAKRKMKQMQDLMDEQMQDGASNNDDVVDTFTRDDINYRDIEEEDQDFEDDDQDSDDEDW